MNDPVWLALVRVFAPLSFLTIGGGQSIVADIHRQAVDGYGWLSDTQFMELFALTRLTPGPGSILVTLVGWKAAGWVGALIASFCIFMPTSVFIYALARVWGHYRTAVWPRAVEAGLAPIAAGMVLGAAATVLRVSEGGPLAWVLTAIATAAFLFTRISPFYLMGAGGVVFLVGWH